MTTIIHWFRQDLRLTDNPGLSAAVAQGRVLPVYILDDADAGSHAMGAGSRWWLHRSLEALSDSMQGKLAVFRGKAGDVLAELAEQHRADGVYWNRCYEPWRLEQDRAIEARLSSTGLDVKTDDSLLDTLNQLGFDGRFRDGCQDFGSGINKCDACLDRSELAGAVAPLWRVLRLSSCGS